MPSHELFVPAHQRFVDFARANPGREAIVCGDERLNYGELDRRASALAFALRAVGVESEQVVGVCLPRRPDAIVALLAILMAGGAYLPMDPKHPEERRRLMIDESRASVVLTTASLARGLRGTSAQLLLDEMWTRPSPNEGGWERQMAWPVSAGGLAYIMYTSGSTGNPKGVMIEHGSLAALARWAVCAFSSDELASVLASSSLGFDISIFELLVPVLVGGRVVLVEHLLSLRGAADEEVTLITTVPSLMSALLSVTHLPTGVRTVCLGGEPLPADLATRLYHRHGVQRVMNGYGPTEDTIFSTASEVKPESSPDIGRPVAGTLTYVLDEHRRMLPRGAVGELYLGGPGIARGYCGREDLTRERFINAAVGNGTAVRRLYRTGDLVRWHVDGKLRYLGRIDEQVKIHGVRVELGEVEAVLRRHPTVREAAVTIRNSSAGTSQLIAFIVSDAPTVSGSILGEFLRLALPETMVPNTFIRVEQLPLTLNGKLDRRRLASLAKLAEEPSRAVKHGDLGCYGLTETERKLGEIWRDVLELKRLPRPDDNFFDLGGDSLLAAVVFAEVEGRMGCTIPTNVVVEAKTLSELAMRLDVGLHRDPRLVSFHTELARGPCVYVHTGAGGLLSLRHFAPALGPEQPFLGIQAYRDRESQGELLSVRDTAVECLSILESVQPSGPFLLVGHSIGGQVAFEMACVLQGEGEDVRFLGLLDSVAPEPLRFAGRMTARLRELLRLSEDGHSWRELCNRAWSTRGATQLLRQAKRLHTPSGINDEAWMVALAAAERDFRPKRFIGRPVVFYARETARFAGSPSLGWGRHATGSVETVCVPGGHTSMLSDPHVHVLAGEVARRLEAAHKLA